VACLGGTAPCCNVLSPVCRAMALLRQPGSLRRVERDRRSLALRTGLAAGVPLYGGSRRMRGAPPAGRCGSRASRSISLLLGWRRGAPVVLVVPDSCVARGWCGRRGQAALGRGPWCGSVCACRRHAAVSCVGRGSGCGCVGARRRGIGRPCRRSAAACRTLMEAACQCVPAHATPVGTTGWPRVAASWRRLRLWCAHHTPGRGRPAQGAYSLQRARGSGGVRGGVWRGCDGQAERQDSGFGIQNSGFRGERHDIGTRHSRESGSCPVREAQRHPGRNGPMPA
jgi:hypothetical protein